MRPSSAWTISRTAEHIIYIFRHCLKAELPVQFFVLPISLILFKTNYKSNVLFHKTNLTYTLKFTHQKWGYPCVLRNEFWKNFINYILLTKYNIFAWQVRDKRDTAYESVTNSFRARLHNDLQQLPHHVLHVSEKHKVKLDLFKLYNSRKIIWFEVKLLLTFCFKEERNRWKIRYVREYFTWKLQSMKIFSGLV